MELDGVDDAIFFQYAIVSFPAFGLFPVHGLETGVRDHYHIVAPEVLALECFHLRIRVVIDQNLQFAVCILFDLRLPLHQGDRRHHNQGRFFCRIVGHDEGYRLDCLAHSHLVTQQSTFPLGLLLLHHPVKSFQLEGFKLAGYGLRLLCSMRGYYGNVLESIPHGLDLRVGIFKLHAFSASLFSLLEQHRTEGLREY